jgi:hypothetical protein
MDEHRTPAERALDLVVFGPAGLALTAVEEFPKLVDKGRHHLEGQVRTARLVGQVAVQMGRRQLDSLTSSWTAKSSPKAPASSPPAPPSPASATAAPSKTSASSAPAPATSTSPVASTPLVPSVPQSAVADSLAGGAPPTTVNGHGPMESLAIPGYDSLSASQVVQRLAGLSQPELMAVRAHEQSHRHRRTILNRVEQLLGGVDAE